MTDHLAKARACLEDSRQYGVSTQAYHSDILAAIAHALVAIGGLLDGQDRRASAIPGLPEGYHLDVSQAAEGDRKWGYALTGPGGLDTTSRFQWATLETALAAGVGFARADALSVSHARQFDQKEASDRSEQEDGYRAAQQAHSHHEAGQTLRHSHKGGDLPHGYYEHPEDPRIAGGQGGVT